MVTKSWKIDPGLTDHLEQILLSIQGYNLTVNCYLSHFILPSLLGKLDSTEWTGVSTCPASNAYSGIYLMLLADFPAYGTDWADSLALAATTTFAGNHEPPKRLAYPGRAAPIYHMS